MCLKVEMSGNSYDEKNSQNTITSHSYPTHAYLRGAVFNSFRDSSVYFSCCVACSGSACLVHPVSRPLAHDIVLLLRAMTMCAVFVVSTHVHATVHRIIPELKRLKLFALRVY